MRLGTSIISDSVLKQHELFKASMQGNEGAAYPKGPADFGMVMDSVLNQNQKEKTAQSSMGQVLSGNTDYASKAMIDAEVASYNFSLMVKVRDSTIQTINQMMNMQM